MNWDAVINGAIIGGIIGGVAGGLAVLLVGFRRPPKCPECGEQLPKVRKPTTRRQALWGGWTCPNCGCEVDRKGKKVGSGE
jgi:predicted RNA-binding Zn-ribbon protein involved in translation (DUF1610 family)